MFDIGFWELLIIAVVLMLVMGPERLPEVAKQAAFLVRKARQGMYRLRSEMQSEIDQTPFADLDSARQEMAELKNDMKQLGRDLADSHENQLAETSVSKEESSAIKESSTVKEPSAIKKNKTPAKKTHSAKRSSKKDVSD